jgi:hypothetical protein
MDDQGSPLARVIAELFERPGFADPGFAPKHCNRSEAVAGFIQLSAEPLDLRSPPDERCPIEHSDWIVALVDHFANANLCR